MSEISVIKKSILGLDLLSVIVILSICLLRVSNGVGSIGLQLCFIFIVFFHPELAKKWWSVVRYFMLVAVSLLLLLVLNSFSYKQAIHEAWGMTRGLLMSLLALYVLQIPQARMYQVFVVVLMICSLLATGIVIWNIYHYGVQQVLQRQWLDSFSHRNNLGSGLAVSFIVGLAALLSKYKSIYQQKIILCFMFWLVIISFVNHSRGAYLAMITASFVVLILWSWRNALIVIIFSTVLIFIVNYFELFGQLLVHNNGSVGNGREFLWPPIIERIMQNPWFGYGLHAINNDPVLQSQKIEQVSNVHSIYLDIVYASGLLGCFFWMVWIILFAIKIKKIIRPNNLVVVYFGIGLLVYTLVHGLVDLDFYSLGTSVMLMLGGVLTIGFFVKERSHENTAHC